MYHIKKYASEIFIKIRDNLYLAIISIGTVNKNIFYGNYRGNIKIYNLFLKNIIKPRRAKIILKNKIFLIKKYEKLHQIENTYLSDLKIKGAVVIPKFISHSMINELIREESESDHKIVYKSNFDGSLTIYNYCPITDNIKNIFFNKNSIIYKIAKNYFQREIYAQTYPHFHIVNPISDSPSSRYCEAWGQVNSSWHYDIPMSLGFFILLNDVGVTDSHTQYITGTHKFFNCNLSNIDRYLSDEYVQIMEREIIDLVGDKGDLIIFDPNGYHRLINFKDSGRMALKFEISCGISIETNPFLISNSLMKKFNPTKLDPEIKHFISGLYPMENKYDFDGKKLVPSKTFY